MDREFANAIGYAADGTTVTTAGFTKKGAGTLTLTQAPTYTGTTKVEDGVLYIVDTYTPTMAAGTAQVPSEKEGYKKFVAGSVGADSTQEVIAGSVEEAAAMATVTVTSEQEDVGIKPSYYKVVATEKTGAAGTYTLSVKFADEVVPVVSEESVDGNQMKFALSNFKKGLYYGIASGDTTELGDPESMTQCTDETKGVDLIADMPADGVKYYKIVVKDAAE